MDLQERKKLGDLTPKELERTSQILVEVMTPLPTATLIGIIAPLIQIHVDFDLERIARSLNGSQPSLNQEEPQRPYLVIFHRKLRQVWYCEQCRHVGCIGIDPHQHAVYTALCLLNEDHTRQCPRCKPQQQQIRVVNPHIENREVLAQNVPSWAINHVAQFLGQSGVSKGSSST